MDYMLMHFQACHGPVALTLFMLLFSAWRQEDGEEHAEDAVDDAAASAKEMSLCARRLGRGSNATYCCMLSRRGVPTVERLWLAQGQHQ